MRKRRPLGLGRAQIAQQPRYTHAHDAKANKTETKENEKGKRETKPQLGELCTKARAAVCNLSASNPESTTCTRHKPDSVTRPSIHTANLAVSSISGRTCKHYHRCCSTN